MGRFQFGDRVLAGFFGRPRGLCFVGLHGLSRNLDARQLNFVRNRLRHGAQNLTSRPRMPQVGAKFGALFGSLQLLLQLGQMLGFDFRQIVMRIHVGQLLRA